MFFRLWSNQEFQNESNESIREFIDNTIVALGSLKRHALASYELWKRGRMDWLIKENYRVRDHLEHLIKEAARCQHWFVWNAIDSLWNLFDSLLDRAVIRFVSSILHKIVDSLAPSVTNLLVRGKIVRFLFYFKKKLAFVQRLCFPFRWRLESLDSMNLSLINL